MHTRCKGAAATPLVQHCIFASAVLCAARGSVLVKQQAGLNLSIGMHLNARCAVNFNVRLLPRFWVSQQPRYCR